MGAIHRAVTPARLLAAVVALVAALVAVLQLGRLHPDEVYQALEPANHAAFGYGILAWEWQPDGGLRNWAVPGLFAGLLKVAAALGLDHPQARRAFLELPQWALHAAMLLAAHRLTARRVDGPWALAAIPLVGLYGPVVHFGGRTLGESFSTAFMVIALERIDAARMDADAKWHVPALGGALLGLAVVTRYGSAVVVIAALIWLGVTRSGRAFLLVCAGGLVVAAALGALDAFTWGEAFHSLKRYLEFNVLSGQAAQQFGSSPASFYLPLLGWLVLWAWPGLVLGAMRRVDGASVFGWCGLAYVAAISMTAHKEPRFLYPGLVLLLVGATPPWLARLARWPKQRAQIAGAASVVAGLAILAFASPFAPERPEQFRLFVKGARDATGFVVVNEGVWGAPGFFYLGKNVPWFTCDIPQDGRFVQAMATPAFNRAITWDDRALNELQAAGFQVLETQGAGKLLGR